MSNHPRRSTSRPWASTARPSDPAHPFGLPEAAPAPTAPPPPPSAAEIIGMASAAIAELGRSGVPELVAKLAATPGWVARAALAVMARLSPEPSHRELASLELRARDEPLPTWAERFDDVVVTAVVQVVDPLGDADLLLLELRWPDAEPLVLLLLIDHNLVSTIKLGAVLERSIDRVLTSFTELADDEPVRLGLTPADARSIIEAAGSLPSPVGEPGAAHAGEVRPLVEWLVGHLPTGGIVPRRPSTTEDERRAIRDRFLDSPWGRALDVLGRSHVVDALLDVAADGDDPLRWSRARLGHLDLGAVADDPWFEPEDLAAVPDLLRALIGFAHEQRGIARRHTDSAMAGVDRACWALRATTDVRTSPSMSAEWWEDEPLDRLAGQVGSRAVLASLDLAPLPDEPFDADGIVPETVPAVEAVLAVVDDVCDRFFDVELRTAGRRLLAAVARRSATAVRHARPDTTAAGIVWLVATANGAFDRHGVRQKDVRSHLGLSSALSSRAHSLRLVLTDGRATWQDELGDAGLLTSARRRWIVGERDRLLEERRALDAPVGW